MDVEDIADIEAMQQKTEELKRIDEMTFDADQFDDVERDYKQFMEELVGNNNMSKFKDEYARIWKMLKSSFEQV